MKFTKKCFPQLYRTQGIKPDSYIVPTTLKSGQKINWNQMDENEGERLGRLGQWEGR